MRNSSILKWAQNNKNSSKLGKTKEEKRWIHSPEVLMQGHVVYLVKFLGSTGVDKPKGIEVVKQGIQKLKFNQQLKKSEGNKTPKVELTISVDGVAIQEPKTKRMMHQYPLHKISYCADDKAEKRFFSFIAKEGESSQHTCFVFVSDKLAEEITLTIGQAFELAYKKFLDTSGKDLEAKKQLLVLQKRISLLEDENKELKVRLEDVANIKGRQDVAEYMKKHDILELCEVRVQPASPAPSGEPPGSRAPMHQPAFLQQHQSPKSALDELICLEVETTPTKLDCFTLDDLNDDDFNPRAAAAAGSSSDDDFGEDDFDPRAPTSAAPPAEPAPRHLPARDPAKILGNYQQNLSQQNAAGSIFPKDDPFAKNPFSGDPFGMSTFESGGNNAANAPNLNVLDGFQNGLVLGGNGGGFSFDDLDPLKK